MIDVRRPPKPNASRAHGTALGSNAVMIDVRPPATNRTRRALTEPALGSDAVMIDIAWREVS